jgi:hypothetical protein
MTGTDGYGGDNQGDHGRREPALFVRHGRSKTRGASQPCRRAQFIPTVWPQASCSTSARPHTQKRRYLRRSGRARRKLPRRLALRACTYVLLSAAGCVGTVERGWIRTSAKTAIRWARVYVVLCAPRMTVNLVHTKVVATWSLDWCMHTSKLAIFLNNYRT